MSPERKFQAFGLVALLGAVALAAVTPADGADSWETVKSQHFLVMHMADEAFATKVADAAENYYQTIAEDLGYARKAGFWLWENRVHILIYPTVDAFRVANNAPGWAAGKANPKLHEIDGCRTSGDGFVANVLPHEMAHLILAEFVGVERLPQWVNEGFAVWEQNGRKSAPPPGGAKTPWFTLEQLSAMDVRQETDPNRVQLYYTQAASLVGFLITTYGGERFGNFCRELRDGKPLNEAVGFAYSDFAAAPGGFERAWRKHVGAPGN